MKQPDDERCQRCGCKKPIAALLKLHNLRNYLRTCRRCTDDLSPLRGVEVVEVLIHGDVV